MKFLLLNSPIYRTHSDFSEDYLPPLGLGYLATHLNMAGIDTSIVDCVRERLGIDEILSLISCQRPDFVGINIFTQNYDIVREILEQCLENVTFVLGGQVVKFIYSEILEWKTDNNLWAIMGESELALPAIIMGTYSESPLYVTSNRKVYCVDKNSIYFPDNLDEIILDRDLLEEKSLINHYGKSEAAIITSRGCPYNCAFCGAARSVNKETSMRFRSPSYIEDEIGSILLKNNEINSIRILDDLFLRDRATIMNAIEIFKKYEDISWRCMTQVVVFQNSLDLFQPLKSSGCCELFFGIESGSKDVRKRINKVGSIKQIENVITSSLEAGIDVKAYFMFGLPNECTSEADETYALATKLKNISSKHSGNFRTSVFQFRPYHGTQLYNEIMQSGKAIRKIGSNESLNVFNGRSQFNFHAGNFSNMEDHVLNKYILETQALTEG